MTLYHLSTSNHRDEGPMTGINYRWDAEFADSPAGYQPRVLAAGR